MLIKKWRALAGAARFIFFVTMSRSFYVGETISQDEIHAKFEDGILRLSIPKEDKQAVEQKKYIAIEG